VDNSNLKETILVVVPCYNESPIKVDTVLEDLFSFGYRNILLVDDGSTQKVKQNKGVELIRLEKNFGQGYALNIGFEYAIKHNFNMF
jgi:glycosyltransferase involved in cell wall biosynthesis